ncbi:IS1595 family transposase [Methylovulum miyakonense]|uniref:IS1595 family transposase n=1 Tax=Methylovulum miyakonense TaxID=645578 RepID=UPI00036C1A18|nr:IS1595 family transposase [Methylovulum miyakonense]
MKTKAYCEWLEGVGRLTRKQRTAVLVQLNAAESREAIVSELESGHLRPCPHCQSGRLGRWGRQSGLQRFRCRDCGKCFNALTGTPLARLRHKERWFDYSQALIEGLTVRKAAERCGVAKTTSFRWRHRFLTEVAGLKATGLTGIVEADETYFPLSFKGSRQLPRPPHRRGHAAHQRGTGDGQVPVLVLRDRHGTTTDFKLTAATQAEEAAIIGRVVAADAVLCTDGGASLKGAARQAGIAHRALNLSAGIRVLAGVYHIQNVNAYDSRLKTWMRRFHGVATKYLDNYLGWRRGLERWGEQITPGVILQAAVGRCVPFQLLTQT